MWVLSGRFWLVCLAFVLSFPMDTQDRLALITAACSWQRGALLWSLYITPVILLLEQGLILVWDSYWPITFSCKSQFCHGSKKNAALLQNTAGGSQGRTHWNRSFSISAISYGILTVVAFYTVNYMEIHGENEVISGADTTQNNHLQSHCLQILTYFSPAYTTCRRGM